MRAGRSKDLVAAAALAGVLGLGGFLFLRSRGAFGSHWTDGLRAFASETGEAVRHAVWDAPVRMDQLGEGTRPTVSPDGRWLVFASGARGLNCELFLAELEGGAPRDPRPLEALNSAADELAPAFGHGALYFASDRPGGAGGLDILRAPCSEGTFGPVERLGPGLNSAADETDPAPLPGTLALFFASDRARPDFDLYCATPDATGFFDCAPLERLNSPADEREPAFSGDPRSLAFASDRPGGAGGFDLYRACRFGSGPVPEGWRAPARVAELCTPRSERAPWLAADGFALWFAQEDENASALRFARSRELFRVPPPTITLAQWLTLAALLLLALLAQLAKRWHALDILYKCLLVSLILHLFLMLYLRTVEPAQTSYEMGTEEGPRFRVRVAPPESTDAGQGLTGPTAPQRQRFEAEMELADAPEALAMELPERGEEAAPAREDALTRAAGAGPSPALAQPAERLERYATGAPALALEARAGAARVSEAAPAGPERAEPGAASLVAAAPGAAKLPATEAAGEELARGAERETLLARGPSTAPAPALAAPAESLQRSAGTAPAFAVDAATPAAREESGDAQPEQLHFAGGPRVAASPAQAGGALLPATGSSSASSEGAPPPERLARSGENDRASPDPVLRAPAAAAAPAPALARAAFDATAGMGSANAAPPPTRELGGPAREASVRPRDAGERPAPSLPLTAQSGTGAEELPAFTPSRSALVANEPESGQAAGPELRAPLAERMDAPRPASASFDAAAGLDVARAPARPGPASPARDASRAPRALGPARPEAPALPLESAAPAPAEALPDRALPPRLAETPYQNRFGEQKLRALEDFGGTAESEHAVAAGLAYLARIQGEGGEWGQRSDTHQKYLDVRVGKSALALLAFLGAGHVPGGASEHAAVADRTVRYLLAVQDEASGHFGRSCSYGHGIATYALAECYALTQEARLRAPLERAVEEILRHQSEREDERFLGGWGYYFADGHVWNDDEWPRTSVTAWQVMALESARLGGLAVPDEAFESARTFLANAWDAGARAFRYDHDPERLSSGYPILPASTPAALFALSLLDVDLRASELAPARRFVLTRAPDGYRYTGDDDFVHHARGNLYFWYYATLALFRVGGAEWERWNAALQATLLPAQDEDGSWRPLDTYSEYARDDDDERTYSTAMCVLSLEIYYRYFTPLLKVR